MSPSIASDSLDRVQTGGSHAAVHTSMRPCRLVESERRRVRHAGSNFETGSKATNRGATIRGELQR
eukprot:scaffold121105_cov35-Attheya_sp.AAC.1